jgi:hypothetical protein
LSFIYLPTVSIHELGVPMLDNLLVNILDTFLLSLCLWPLIFGLLFFLLHWMVFRCLASGICTSRPRSLDGIQMVVVTRSNIFKGFHQRIRLHNSILKKISRGRKRNFESQFESQEDLVEKK